MNDESKLFIEERQKEILDFINSNEKASVEELMANFGISKSTVRRDLIDLEKRNLLTRTHGGALKKKFFKYESTLDEKKDLNSAKKKKIGRIAGGFISNGDVIYLSGGTTTLELAKLLHGFERLVVFTNAVNILFELVNHNNIEIKFLGGDFRRKTLSCVGIDTINTMHSYRFEKAFIGANGVSVKEGVTTPNELEAKVDGEVVRRSINTYLLVDDTKFDAIAYSVICEIHDISHIITNKIVNEEVMKALKEKNVEVIFS